MTRFLLPLFILAVPAATSSQTAIPPREQALLAACSPNLGAVSGQVVERTTGVAMGSLDVRLSSAGGGTLTHKADGQGRFVFCDLTPGRYELTTIMVSVGEARAAIRLVSGGRSRAELRLAPAGAADGIGEIYGRVVALVDGQPLAGAEVRLGDRRAVLTDGRGDFSFEDVAPGGAPLSVRLVGYATANGTVEVSGGQAVTLEVRMTEQPIELDPIVVEAVRFDRDPGLLAPVRRRAEMGWGQILIGEELEAVEDRAMKTTDMLYQTTITPLSNGTAIYSRRHGCGPHVYIDGVRVTHLPRRQSGGGGGDRPMTPEIEAAQAVNMVAPSNIAALEVYDGPANIPPQYLDSDARCGVILIWTKRGGG